MTPNASPLPIRHSNNLRRVPSRSRTPIDVDELDELAADTVPCSPGAVLRHDDTTQPTQVLGQPTNLRSSSPPSVVEVPASSPFQPAKRPSLGSRLAPAGTVFRPPPQHQHQQQPSRTSASKRPAPDSIEVISDDDDDLTPPRGDIRPTTFQSKISSYTYRPPGDDEKRMREKLRQIFGIFGPKYTSDVVRQALSESDGDVDRAIDWLERYGSQMSSRSSAPSKAKGRRLVNQATLQAASTSSSSRSGSGSGSRPTLASSRSVTPSPQKPRPKKRRLIQGLKNPGTPSPQKQFPESFASSEDPLVIDLADNDKDDAYEAERSPTPDQEGDSKVLSSINKSTLKELGAMTSMKDAELELIIANRPFSSLGEVRAVTTKKPGARKSSRTNVGDTVVDAIEVFLNAVESIDHIVAECEKKAKMVRDVIDSWDIDSFGHDRRSTRNTPDLPPTPTSFSSSKIRRPPIPKQPSYMDGHCQMKPFQLFGLNWMSLLHTYDIGCILADEMGLGKTCQVISFMSHLAESFNSDKRGPSERPWPNLIVVPPSTYNNWLAEFDKFAPELSVVGYRGSQSERAEIAYEVEQAPEEYHVVLATYSQINSDTDIQSLNSMSLHAAIFDEGHKMKNPNTKIYRDLRLIRTDWKMLLTGTPVQNNLLEMTSLLSFINPSMFAGCMEHIKYIFSTKVSIRDVSNGAFLYSERVKRARTILEPFILQRRKDQVLSDLPKKVNRVVHCEMTESQKPIYDEYEVIFRKEPSQRVARTTGRQNDQNNVWMQLRKAAIHPILFRRHFTDAKVERMGKILMENLPQSELHQDKLEHLVQELKNSSDFELHLWCRDYHRLLGKFDYAPGTELESGKVKKLLELIDSYQENGDRVLVFSKFSRVIELVREILALKGIDHRVLMGNTNVSERQVMIDEFNEDADIPVFLLTTGAGGTGINLTSANKVVILDQSDNPQDDIQAENRAHRLGQMRDVEVIRLLSRGTIEELIYKACEKKIELANKVTGAEGEGQEAVTETEHEAQKNMEHEVRKMMEDKMTPP